MILYRDKHRVTKLTHVEVKRFRMQINPDRLYVWGNELFIPLDGLVLVEAMWGTRDNTLKVRLVDRIKGAWR